MLMIKILALFFAFVVFATASFMKQQCNAIAVQQKSVQEKRVNTALEKL